MMSLSSLNNENLNDEIIDFKSKCKRFPVMFKRAVCIHSSLQFVDLFMQNLMFSHGFSSTPIIARQEDETEVLSKTMLSFYKIRNEFREIFRSHHRGNVSEVAIFIGTCPVRSTYSYRVPITICEAEDSTHKSCGDTCAELNDFERRKINRDLFMHSCSKEQQSNETNKTNKNHRLFVFIKGSEDMVNEEIEEEDPPFGSKQSFHYSFIHEKCNCDGVPAPRNDGKWLRMVPYIVHSKH